MLFAMNKGQLREPLSQFQAIEFQKDELLELVRTINSEQGDGRLSDSVLERSFEKWWPDLEINIDKIIREYHPKKVQEKSQEEYHEEVIGMLRNIIELRVSDLTRHVAEDIFVNIYANIDAALESGNERMERIEALLMLARNIEYLHLRLHKSPQHIERATHLIDRLAYEKGKLEKSGLPQDRKRCARPAAHK